ncbi:MAG: sigma-70 family RNA polymerase sigma factor [Deltaproteobacteria bacterium]|nr:sigma-70 family RNA polymerase sigma factor [Kofleriaceae bacterium]
MDAELVAIVAAHRSAWIEAGRAAWPAIALDDERFVAFVAARLSAVADPAAIAAADLWLACACLAHDPAALHGLDAQITSLRPVLGAMRLDDDRIDELLQELRAKLLVDDPDGSHARLADYSGRADLRTWLRTAVTRAAIDVLRKRVDHALPDDDEVLAAPALGTDPELAALRARYREPFKHALLAAVAALDARDRALLRFHYVQGYAIDRIAAVYGVHRATAARWLVAAREALARATQHRLVQHLGVTLSEVQSLARLVESQLDLSLRRLLPTEPDVG